MSKKTKNIVINKLSQLADLAATGRKLRVDGQAHLIPERVRFKNNFLINLEAPWLKVALDLTYAGVLSHFNCLNVGKDEGNKKAKHTIRGFWEIVAASGFTDSSAAFLDTWHKPCSLSVDQPRANYAYSVFEPKNWNKHDVYSHVLGTSPDLLHTLTQTDFFQLNNIAHIVEPMAASAELCYFGHLTHPDLTYSMIDLDESCVEHTQALPWLEGTKYEYVCGDVLQAPTWSLLELIDPKKVTGKVLCYIGKQSHNMFLPVQMAQFLDLCMKHCDYVMLEVMEYDPCDFYRTKPSYHTIDLTPPHLKNSDIKIVMSSGVEVCDNFNRLTMESNLRVDVQVKGKNVNNILDYPIWYQYTPATIIAVAETALGVDRTNIWFDGDCSGRFVPIDNYTPRRNEVGSIDCKKSDAFVTLILSRK